MLSIERFSRPEDISNNERAAAPGCSLFQSVEQHTSDPRPLLVLCDGKLAEIYSESNIVT
jgi:hypothetical protein